MADAEKRRKVLSLDDLSKPSQKVMSGKLYHIGRALTKEIVEFIDVKLPAIQVADDEFYFFDDEVIPVDEARAVEEVGFYGFRYITGPPGTGKSTSLRMAVKYLSAKYESERPVRRKIVFVDGINLFNDPLLALSNAVRKAGTSVTPENVFEFLTTSETRYTIVVDDGNRVPFSSRAAILLASLISPGFSPGCIVVFCASVSSEWAPQIRKPKTHHRKIVTKGLEGDELEEFCKFYDIDRKVVDMYETGTNLRLLLDYKAGVIESTIAGLEIEATEYLTKAVSNKRDRDNLVSVMTETTPLWSLDPIQESKCFYVTEDGSLDCLTDGLRSFCKAKMAELIHEAEVGEQYKLIALLTQAIVNDINTIRIGWNSEEAVLLALKFLKLDVPYAPGEVFNTGAPAVEVFKGQMSADKLSRKTKKSVPRLHVPKSFTHKGLDFYLELEDTIVAFQVSVAENAEARHHLTVETAEELFQAAGKRVNILIYVIPCDKSSSEQVKSVKYTNLHYWYVKMSFGELSDKLVGIDERLKQIRGSSSQVDKIYVGTAINKVGTDMWLACDVCHLWYHQRCVGYEITPENAVLRRRPLRLRELPAPTRPLTREFECQGCKDYVKRKSWQSKANRSKQISNS